MPRTTTPKAPATDHPVLGRLPVGWKAVRLGDVVTTFSGGTPSRRVPEYFTGAIPWIKSGELNSPRIDKAEECITDEAIRHSSAKLVQPGTVLLAIYGATAGMVSRTYILAAINQAILAIAPDPELLDADFLEHILRRQAPTLVGRLTQGGQPNLSAASVRSTWIPLPPLPEQRRIARILGTWDKAISLLGQQISAKEERLRGLIDQLVSGKRLPAEASSRRHGHGAKGDKLPKGWRWVSLGEAFEFRNGYNTSKEFYGSGVPFVNVLDVITHRKLTPERIKGKVQIPDEAWAVNDVRKGDLLFNRTSEITAEVGLGSVYIGDEVVTFGGFVIRGRPLKEVFDNDYLAYAIRHASLRKQITSMGSGAIRSNIGQSDLLDVRIMLPLDADQRTIGRTLTSMDDEIDLLRTKLAQLHEQKRGLMQRLLAGGKWIRQ